MSEKIIIKRSLKKNILLLLGSMVFTIIGILFILYPNEFHRRSISNPEFVTIIGITGVTFFGLGTIFLLLKLFDKKPGLIIDETGITDNTSLLSIGLIQWKDIKGIESVTINKSHLLFIKVHNPSDYISKGKTYIKRLAMKVNSKMYSSPISISASTLDIKFKDLQRLLRHRISKEINTHHNNG